MTRAFVPGSFDPPTIGHLNIFLQCAVAFDEVIIGIGVNPSKTPSFTPEERVSMIEGALPRNLDAIVSVIIYEGLTVKQANLSGCQLIVRGVRGVTDFLEEMTLAQVNMNMEGIPTVFMPTEHALGITSSSLVKELYRLGGNWQDYVPPIVQEAINRKGI